jgi:L-threonylcarbamoyladenylate synthase
VKILRDNQETSLIAAAVIKDGGVVAFRTDTFYGLAVDPFNTSAVQRLKSAKGRDDAKPILLLISDQSQLARLVAQRTPTFDKAVESFWPGPITLVINAVGNLPVEITAGTGTVGLRLPSESSVRNFVYDCGGALTATSANVSGKPPARNAVEVAAQLDERIDLIVDAGEVTVTEPSTVLDVTHEPAKLIREGALSRATISAILDIV